MIITDKVIGTIKELNGVNCAPYVKTGGNFQPSIDEVFGYIQPPYSRLHDC